MVIRILIAGIVGGALIFFMGAFNHMALQLMDRNFVNFQDEAAIESALKANNVKEGIYSLPGIPKGSDANDPQKIEQFYARYKAGPSGTIIIAPTGQDMMTGITLGMEFATNTAAALLVAWIVSLIGSEAGFFRRWLAVVAVGVVGWLSLSASYGIWYRFPHAFIHDELYCVLLEWLVAGLAIAFIVKPPPAAIATK